MKHAALAFCIGMVMAKMDSFDMGERWLAGAFILGCLAVLVWQTIEWWESPPNARAREDCGLLNPNRGAPMATYRDDDSRTFTVDERAWHASPVDRPLGQFVTPTSAPFGTGL